MREILGYKITEEEWKKLHDELKEDIILRYDNREYWDPDIVEDFAIEHCLKRAKEDE